MTPVSLIAIGQLTFYHNKMQEEEDAATAADGDDLELHSAIQLSNSAQQVQQQQHDLESQLVSVAPGDAAAAAAANGGYGSKNTAATAAAAAPADAATVSHAGLVNQPTLDNLKSFKQ
jgi:hypothetical protein